MKQRIAQLSNRRWATISPLLAHTTITSIVPRIWSVAGPTASTPRRFIFASFSIRGTNAFVLYDLEPDKGEPFRNTEFVTGSGGKIKTIEVYFGSKIGRVEDIK
jgi:hypothetical protein